MTEYIVAAVVAALLIVVLACSLLGGAHWALNRWRPNGPDVGMALVVDDEVDEDINNPKVATIDEALAMTTDQAARDWLLDKRIDAMRRAS